MLSVITPGELTLSSDVGVLSLEIWGGGGAQTVVAKDQDVVGGTFSTLPWSGNSSRHQKSHLLLCPCPAWHYWQQLS